MVVYELNLFKLYSRPKLRSSVSAVRSRSKSNQ